MLFLKDYFILSLKNLMKFYKLMFYGILMRILLDVVCFFRYGLKRELYVYRIR